MEMWFSHSNSGSTRSAGVIGKIKALFGKGDAAKDEQPKLEAPKRTRGLDCNQFSKVEAGEGSVFVTKVPESRYFDDAPEYTPVIRPVYNESLDDFEVPEQTSAPRVSYREPADMFSNARKRPTYDAIDFNEIVYKQESAPVARPAPQHTGLVEKDEVFEAPAIEEVVETPAVEETFEMPVAEEVVKAPAIEEVVETPAVEEVVETPAVEETEFLASAEPEVPAYDVVPDLVAAVSSAEAVSRAVEETEVFFDVDAAGFNAMECQQVPETVAAEPVQEIDDIMVEIAVAEAVATAFHEAVLAAQEQPECYFDIAVDEYNAMECQQVPETVEEPVTETAVAEPAVTLALPQAEPLAMLEAPKTAVADTVVVQPVVMVAPRRFQSIEALEKEAAELEDANFEPVYPVMQAAMTSAAAEAHTNAVSLGYSEPNLRSDVIEVIDLNRDVLYAYRPSLANDEDMFLCTSRDDDADLPEDGLEGYDRKFKLRVSNIDQYAYRFSGNLRQLW